MKATDKVLAQVQAAYAACEAARATLGVVIEDLREQAAMEADGLDATAWPGGACEHPEDRRRYLRTMASGDEPPSWLCTECGHVENPTISATEEVS